jgi:hypothetical protein
MAKSAKPMNDLFYANLIVIPVRGSQQSSDVRVPSRPSESSTRRAPQSENESTIRVLHTARTSPSP